MDLADSLGMLNQSIQFAGATMGAVKDKKFIREENEKSRQFQLEMWNKMNEYNMPAAVLQRYSDAGIQVNPNYLVTGKYDGGLASLASSPGHSAPNMNSKDIAKSLDMLAPALQIQAMRNQTEVAKSQVELNNANAFKATQQGNLASNEYEIKSKDEVKEAMRKAIITSYESDFYDKETKKALSHIITRQDWFDEYFHETNFKVQVRKPGTNEFSYVDMNGYQLDAMKLIYDLEKLGLDKYQTMKTIDVVMQDYEKKVAETYQTYESIELMKTEEFKNLTQGELNKSQIYLNTAIRALTYAQRDSVISNMKLDFFKALKLISEKHHLDVDAVAIEQLAMNAVRNGDVDEYVKYVSQHYGNNMVGMFLNPLYEQIYLYRNSK